MMKEQILSQQQESLEQTGLQFDERMIEVEVDDPETGGKKKQLVKTRVLRKPSQDTVNAVTALSHTPSDFDHVPGIVALREKYQRELAAATGCKGCVRGALLKKYLPYATMLLRERSENHGKAIDSGTAAVPAPGGARAEGAPKRETMLRRAAAHIAKIFQGSKSS